MKSLKYHFLWLVVIILGTVLTVNLLQTAPTEAEKMFASFLLILYYVSFVMRVCLIILTLWARLLGY